MKRIVSLLLCFASLAGLCACGENATGGEGEATAAVTYQEYYDLGVQYLSEGSYEEVIIAFTAAIEVDPMQPEAYLGRAEVYVQTGEYELALEDCEVAIAIDEAKDSMYIKAAELCLAMGDNRSAMEYLQRGLQKTGSEDIQSRVNEWLQTALYEVLDAQSAKSVSSEPFLTSVGIDLYPFPDEISGFVSGTVADVDMDGQAELLSLYFENGELLLRKYEMTVWGEVSETVLGTLPTLGYCDQMDAILYYSPALDCWCIAVSDIFAGAYTGVKGLNAWLYTIGQDEISQYHVWDWNTFVYSWDDLDELQKEMASAAWPYMDNSYLSFRNETSLASCAWLLRTEVEITDGMMPTEYTRYMRFLSSDELKSLLEEVR